MKIVAKTDKGLVRENNQDAYAVGELPGEVAWAVVCDGMGGAAGGNIASALAVKVISDKITSSYNEKMRDSSIKNLLDSAITAANIEVYDMAYSRPDLKGMGTTVVAVVVRDNVAHIAHAGDSRAYIVNKDGVEQITVDHSLVQNLVDRKKLNIIQIKMLLLVLSVLTKELMLIFRKLIYKKTKLLFYAQTDSVTALITQK